MKRLLPVILALFAQIMFAAHALATPGSTELTQIANLSASLDQKYAAGTISSAEQAELALQESNAAQLRLQSWYEQSERACHDTFFVNDCLSDVKQKRRQYIVALQRIALEAKALQRKLRIEQLDRELAQRQAKP